MSSTEPLDFGWNDMGNCCQKVLKNGSYFPDLNLALPHYEGHLNLLL